MHFMWRAKMAAVLAAAAMLTAVSGCGSTQQKSAMLAEAEASGGANYRTAVAQVGDLIKTSELSIEPTYYLSQTLYCQESGLYFDSFSVSRGQLVEEGQLIATFTRKGSEAELESAKLALQRAEEEYEKTSARLLDEVSAAGAKGSIYVQLAQLELDQYEYNQSVQLEKLRSDVADAEAAFENEYIYAPFDCIVSSLASLDKGAEVDVGKELAVLDQADSLVLLSSSTAKNFLYNMNVTVEYGRKDSRKTVTARVVAADSVLPEGVAGTGHTYFKLDEALTEDELTKPSASVTTVQAQNALLVPRGAVEVEDGNYYVSVLDGGMVKKRYVIRGITGGTVGESCTVILAGLSSGQTVILN